MDFFIIYLMELIHKYKIYQYLGICHIKYERRKTDLLNHAMNLDVSLKTKYRSIDFFCFSEQYYYAIIIIGGGITMVVWSIGLCYNNEYIPF